MNRTEAAVKAWDHYWGEHHDDDAANEAHATTAALAAADAVMFNDAAVDRIAWDLREKFEYLTHSDGADIARAVITALKEGTE